MNKKLVLICAAFALVLGAPACCKKDCGCKKETCKTCVKKEKKCCAKKSCEKKPCKSCEKKTCETCK